MKSEKTRQPEPILDVPPFGNLSLVYSAKKKLKVRTLKTELMEWNIENKLV